MLWVARGLMVGGGAAIGVLFEKLSAWVSGLLPASVNVRDKKSGGYAIWFVVALTAAAGAVVYFIAKAIAGKKKVFTVALALAACALDFAFGFDGGGVIFAGVIASIAASATESKSIPFCPEFLIFNTATVPTSLKVEVAGDGVIVNLDGAGITNLNGLRNVGALPANQYMFQIADGHIQKNTTITIANATVAAISVKGFSNSRGSMYHKHLMAKIFANANFTLKDFAYAALPTLAATDSVSVTWQDNTTDIVTREELECLIATTQEVSATRYNIDNFERAIKRVQIIAAADMTLYYTKYSALDNVNNDL